MTCNYGECPAKTHIDTLKERLEAGNSEFESIRKENRETNRRITEIATNQTKISSDLLIHMNRSDDKHIQIVSLIQSLEKRLSQHTAEEMEVQNKWIDELGSVKDTVKEHTRVLKYIIGGATVIGLFLWDYIKIFIDMFMKNLLGL